MALKSKFWYECDPPRGECTATSPERDTAKEAQDAAWEAGWHLDGFPAYRNAQCPRHIRAIDRVDWGFNGMSEPINQDTIIRVPGTDDSEEENR